MPHLRDTRIEANREKWDSPYSPEIKGLDKVYIYNFRSDIGKMTIKTINPNKKDLSWTYILTIEPGIVNHGNMWLKERDDVYALNAFKESAEKAFDKASKTYHKALKALDNIVYEVK